MKQRLRELRRVRLLEICQKGRSPTKRSSLFEIVHLNETNSGSAIGASRDGRIGPWR